MNQQIAINTLTTLGEDYLEIWIDAFIKAKQSENLSKKSIQFYKHTLKIFADYAGLQSVKTIHQITPNFIREFLLWLENKGHNSGGIHAEFRAVRTLLFWYWEEVEPEFPNPIKKVKAPRLIQEPIKGVTPDEFRILLSACPKGTFNGERDRAILSVLMDTGVRANELCNIKLEDINIIESSILIRQGKGRKPRTVFIGNTTRKQIRKYLRLKGKDSDYLFTNRNGDRLLFTALREVLRRLGKQTNIKGITAHDFRRGFCLACLNRGMDLLTLSRLMGHTGLSLLSRYASQTSSDIQNKYRSVVDE